MMNSKNILFLFISSFGSINQHEIYPDLVRKFILEGFNVYIVCSNERRKRQKTEFVTDGRAKILRVKIGNIQKCKKKEKGVSTLLIKHQYRYAITKYLSGIRFDAIVYATPPITLVDTIRYYKKRDSAFTYLMLKDIFPQNAIDLSLLRKSGIKGMIYHYFRYKEKELYKVSDYIGCMSEANRNYIIKNNPYLRSDSVEICPNCFEVRNISVTEIEKKTIREEYGIPVNRIVFIYGGNLGKPQGISFFLECLKTQKNNRNVFFLIVGSGTEFKTIDDSVKREQYENVKMHSFIPTSDFERLISACDVGLIFLDHRFTIPNFPSRLLSYMQSNLPIIACTDTVTDIRNVIEENEIGWWCESNDSKCFSQIVQSITPEKLKSKGRRSFEVLKNQYDVSIAYNAIVRHFEKE